MNIIILEIILSITHNILFINQIKQNVAYPHQRILMIDHLIIINLSDLYILSSHNILKKYIPLLTFFPKKSFPFQ